MATVCSVRVQYNERHFFLDREKSDWKSLSGENLALSTADILSIFSFT
jgi:hypothetical protein